MKHMIEFKTDTAYDHSSILKPRRFGFKTEAITRFVNKYMSQPSIIVSLDRIVELEDVLISTDMRNMDTVLTLRDT